MRLININGITDRLQSETRGEIFIAFNRLHGHYELHACSDLDENRNSCNAVIPEEFLNEWIVRDYKANNHIRNGQELQDAREKIMHLYERNEKRMEHTMTTGRLGIVKRALGREDI